MLKRPFLVMAVFLILFCLGYKFLGFEKNKEIDIDKTVNIKAKLIKVEEKKFSDYYFVDSEKIGKAIIVMPKDIEIKIGQIIYAECKNIGFNEARNFGNFDEQNYYQSLGYGYKLKLKEIKELSKSYDFIRQNLYIAKKKIIKIIDESVGENKSGIFKAIIAGDKTHIDEDTKELYSQNGIAHILAISGLHISLIGLAIFNLLKKRFSALISGIICSLFMIGFCIMSGESVSAIRATIMFVLRMVALIFGKSFDMLNALSFSAIVLLISNPLYIFNASFLLSFMAILAIALFANGIIKFLFLNPNKNKFFISIITSASVFIITLPIIANSYYEISLFSVFLNLLVIPLMSFVLGSALFSTLLGIVSIAISRFAIGIGVFLLDTINFLCFITDKIHFSVIVTGNYSWIKIIVFYFICTIFIIFISKKTKKDKSKVNKKSRKVMCVFCFAILLIISFIKIPDSKLHISYLDVDQGDCIFIKTPKNTTILIDGGSSSVSKVKEYRIESALKYKKISKIDYAIVTHPDTDHISGLLEIISDNKAGAIKINRVYIPYIKNNENYEILKEACNEKNIIFKNIYAGMELYEDNLKIKCLHPSTTYTNTNSVNAYSTVLDLEYGNFSALFVGDLEDDGERLLLNKNLLHKYDLLKVSHHGSKYSSSKEFLEKVSPSIAVISAGVNNSYGHPHNETLERLEDIKTKVYCTSWNGEIDLLINKEGHVAVKTKL